MSISVPLKKVNRKKKQETVPPEIQEKFSAYDIILGKADHDHELYPYYE